VKTKTKEVEFILSYEKLFSVVVDAPVGEDGEVDWIEAEKLMYQTAASTFQRAIESMTGVEITEDLLIQDCVEV